jgi:hypothetical protein
MKWLLALFESVDLRAVLCRAQFMGPFSTLPDMEVVVAQRSRHRCVVFYDGVDRKRTVRSSCHRFLFRKSCALECRPRFHKL